MTPLAFRVMKDLVLAPRDRWLVDSAGISERMSGIHCFDLTGVSDVFDCLRQTVVKSENCKQILGQTSFLPAKRTWLEGNGILADSPGMRFAVHLEEGVHEGEKVALVSFLIQPEECERPVARSVGAIRLGEFGMMVDDARIERLFSDPEANRILAEEKIGQLEARTSLLKMYRYILTWSELALAIINTPKIVGRETRHPHKGLARKLCRLDDEDGRKFSVREWTEIKLDIFPDSDGQTSGASRLSGQKALHFCRSHIRVRLGKLEIVRAHWRGDAALGIVRSRYRAISNGGVAQ